jgi:rhamnogalacturonan endolyase
MLTWSFTLSSTEDRGVLSNNWGIFQMRIFQKVSFVAVALAVVGAQQSPSVAAEARCNASAVFSDDFSRFSPGWLSYPRLGMTGPFLEYHYLPDQGVPTGPWANPITHYDAWLAGDDEGRPFIEQHLVNDLSKLFEHLFITGDPAWADYEVEVEARPLALNGPVGVTFRYGTNRHYYRFSLEDGKRARLVLRGPVDPKHHQLDLRELASAVFPYETKRYYRLKVEAVGHKLRAFIDGKLVLETTDQNQGSVARSAGKVGVTANVPARFRAFKVSMCAAAKEQMQTAVARREDELKKLRADNPQAKLWRKFDTTGFGAGRDVRFGDLDGDGRIDMLIGQLVPHVYNDAFSHLSAVTAVTLEGKVLWQIGRPDPRNAYLTNDMPFQIHDVDGDGRNDVVMVRDFKMQILDGRTGKLKKWAWMPKAPNDPPRNAAPARPYEIYSGDAMAFVNVSGGKGRTDILLKNRYNRVWVFNKDLKPLWEGKTNTGHYPFPIDLDGDGRDEIFIGYSLWNHKGQRLWAKDDVVTDHADGVAVANLGTDPKAAPRVYWVASDEGALILDQKGNILKQLELGHTQNATIAKLRPDLPGRQMMTINFWRSPGVTSVIDSEGNLVLQGEPHHAGSSLMPVNWRGDGQEFVLLSGNVKKGGLIDGHLRQVVQFPDDGHPDMTGAVLDVTGDARDEVILWDPKSVWIYTQDRPAIPNAEGKIYAPTRNPTYNDSNYRFVVSEPAWRSLPIKTAATR